MGKSIQMGKNIAQKGMRLNTLFQKDVPSSGREHVPSLVMESDGKYV